MMSWIGKCLCLIHVLFATSNARNINIKEAELAPIELDEVLSGTFGVRSWNGSWISDVSFIYKNEEGDVLKFNLDTNTIQTFLEASVLANYTGSTITVSNDEAYVLIRYNVSSVFRHSTTALYTIYDVTNRLYYNIANLQPVQLVTFAPKGHGLVYVRENNIHYLDDFSVDVQNPIVVTSAGNTANVYCGVPDWVYEEEVLGSGSALWFSPNATHIAYAVFHDENVTNFSYYLYGEPGTLENQYPEEAIIKYPKVGTTNPTVNIYVYNIASAETIEFQLPSSISNKVPNDYVLYDLTWVSNEEVAMISTNRIQNESIVIRCNVGGPCKEEISYEEQNGWLEPKIPLYSKDGKQRLEILPVQTYNDKFDHLVLTDTENFTRIALTSGRSMVLNIYGWDEDSGLIYYSGTHPEDYYQQHVFVVDLLGNRECLSCDIILGTTCTNAAAAFSKSLSYYVKVCNGPIPHYVVLQDAKNPNRSLVWEDNRSLRERLELKLQPRVEDLAIAIDETFVARVRLYLPPNLDEFSPKKYPAVVNVYGGPNSNQISNVFGINFKDYITTKREYIYIFIDGRGSGKDGRNKMFTMYKKFGTVEIEDQISITRYLQETYQYIDAKRTGIWGWSYGGFASSWALAKDKDHVFNFALAVAPVTNFIYYDTIYTERYMGLPRAEDNEIGYNNSDLASQVEAFRGRRYFIIHGNADDNVHYQNSMLLVKALELADIDFRQQSYPDENHSLGHVSRHLYHTIDKYWASCFDIEGPPITSWNNLTVI